MSRPMDHRDVGIQQGLSAVPKHGLSTEFHRQQMGEAEAARIQKKNTDQESKGDKPEAPQYRDIEDLKKAINDSNAALENQVAQRTGNNNSSELPVASLQRITNLFDWTVRGQQIQLTQQHQQIEQARAIQLQATALEPKSDPSKTSQETSQEGRRTNRTAFGDIANTTERGQIPSSIETDNNSVNPKRKREISQDSQHQQILNDLKIKRIKTDLPEVNREELKEQVKAEFKQAQKKEQQQLAKQESANRLRYQGVVLPNSDAAQSDKKSAADTDSKTDPQLSQKESKLSDAFTRLGQINPSSSEAQGLRNTIEGLQSAIQAAKAKANDASKSHT